MTEALAGKTCTPCRGGIPPLAREQAELFHTQTPDWQLRDDAHRIERRFSWKAVIPALTITENNPAGTPWRLAQSVIRLCFHRVTRIGATDLLPSVEGAIA